MASLLERLKERAKKTKAELDQEKEKEKRNKLERDRLEANERAPHYKKSDAWCYTCLKDCTTIMRKHGNERLAYYLGTCPVGHTVRREITLVDRYYQDSYGVRLSRLRHANDLLTPNDYMFRHVYPDKWQELERQREARETIK